MAHDGATDALPGGLTVSADGYTLTPLETGISTATARTLRFTITGPDGARLTSYTRQHDKDLHLILVRRDTGGYQHLHPVLGQDGIWSVPVKAEAAGDYRAIADFVPGQADAHPVALGVDLHASGGQYNPQPLPPAAATATVDGFTVNLNGHLQAGASSELTLTITRYGRPVTDLQAYLGAYGHLVALRVGDLAYLHVHPNGEPGDGHTTPGPTVSFMAEVPTAGTYRLYLDFKHAGTVHTAEFTATAAA